MVLIGILQQSPALAWDTVEYADVMLGPQKLFSVTNTKFMSAAQRAQTIASRLSRAMSDPTVNPAQLEIRRGLNDVPVITLADESICTATDQDASSFGVTRGALTTDWFNKIRTALSQERTAATQGAKSPAALASEEQRQKQSRRSASLSEHAVLLLFLQIALLLLSSLICGEVMVRLGQPAIIGQILAGVLLGHTVMGNLFPDWSLFLFPEADSQSKLIQVVSWIGVSFLLMLTGMESDASVFKRLGKPALAFAVIGLVGPLVVGALVSYLVPAEYLEDPTQRMAFALFLGTVFAVSSVPVVGKLLSDMHLLKRDVGQLVLSASLAHDLLCCLLLAVIAVLAGTGSEGGGGTSPLLIAVLGTIGFLAVMYFGRPVFFALLRWVNDKISTSDGLITAIVVLLLLCAATTQALGVHIVLGAFAAGVILSQAPVINAKLVRPLETVTMGFFAPIFFASACLNVDLTVLLQPKLAIITILLSLVAVISKLVACYGAGKVSGPGTWESISVGIGANAKGSMGIILAMLGRALNLITTDMFAIVIFIALFSTAIVPALLKWSLSKVVVTPEEEKRVSKQERQSRTIINSIRRILWPTAGTGAHNLFIAKLINSCAKHQVIETTVLWVKGKETQASKPFADILHAVDRKHVGVMTRTVKSSKIVEAITEEANRGYDLVVMMEDKPSGGADYVFGKLTDNVILHTSTRALIVCAPQHFVDKPIERVLVPVSGSDLSLSAGEFGISLAHALKAKVTCVCIHEPDASELYSTETQSGQKIQNSITNEIEESLTELAEALEVDFNTKLLGTEAHAAQAILLAATQNKSDLIVLGAEPKLGKGLFMGHTINYILRHAECPVIVLKL